MPRLLKAPLPFPPHQCLVTASEEGELIDFERDYPGDEPRIYLRRDVVEEAARDCCGMVSIKEVEDLRLQVAEFGQRLDQALGDLDLTRDFEAKFSASLEAGVEPGATSETESSFALSIKPARPGEEGTP